MDYKGNFGAVANLENNYMHEQKDSKDGMARIITSKTQGYGLKNSSTWTMIVIHKEKGYFCN